MALVVLWAFRSSTPAATACPPSDPAKSLCALLAGDPTDRLPIAGGEVSDLRSLYGARNYAPIWSGSSEVEQQARAARSRLGSADQDGLDPSEYRTDDRTPSAAGDILLTDAVLRYARDLRTGRVPVLDRGNDVSLPAPQIDLVHGLSEAIAKNTVAQFLDAQKPSEPEYGRLATALARYRAIDAHGGWPILPPAPAGGLADQPLYQAALATRLSMEGFAVDTNQLAASLSQYQQTHGLHVDGKFGKETLEALNVPAAVRADTIAANMERWRWMPRPLEASYIMVNVPANTLEVVDKGESILSSRVVAGRPHDPSPILRAEVRGIVVNPPWNVPAKIARREIFPKLRADPNYLAKNDMVLRNGQLQQQPGAKSALGTIKLDMPNPFDVYLHDTPARNAFALDKRNLSHGCVRVQAILPLASIVLTGDPTSGEAKLQDAIAAGATQSIAIPAPLPVYFAYWTAFVDQDGTAEFRPDVYRRDERLLAILHHAALTRLSRATVGCPVG